MWPHLHRWRLAGVGPLLCIYVFGFGSYGNILAAGTDATTPATVHIITCIAPATDRELRYNERKLATLLVWNASASGFKGRTDDSWGLRVRNVCTRFRKGDSRLDAIEAYLESKETNMERDIVVVTESGSLFNSVDIVDGGALAPYGGVQELVNRFEKTRGDKAVLLAAEPWCRFQASACNRDLEELLYPSANSSYADKATVPCPRYVSSGNFMGTAAGVTSLVRSMKGLSILPAHNPKHPINDDTMTKWNNVHQGLKSGKLGEQAWMQFLHAFGSVSSKLDTEGHIFAASCASSFGSRRYKGVQLTCGQRPCAAASGSEFDVVTRHRNKFSLTPIFKRQAESAYAGKCGLNAHPLILQDPNGVCQSWHERAQSSIQRAAYQFASASAAETSVPSVSQKAGTFSRLHILTCVTDAHGTKSWKIDPNFNIWNVSASGFTTAPGSRGQIIVRNVCDGLPWLGMATKSREYEKYLRGLVGGDSSLQSDSTSSPSGDLVMITDGLDVLFNSMGRSVDEIIQKYRAAVGSKEILLSSEMWCWIGMPCAPDHEAYLYGPDSWVGKRSACPRYLNAGAYLGTASGLHRLVSLTWSLMFSLKGAGSTPKTQNGHMAAGMGATEPPPEVEARYKTPGLMEEWLAFRELPGWKTTKVFSRVPTEQGTIQFLHAKGYVSTTIDLKGELFSTGCVAQLDDKKSFHGFKCGQVNCPLQQKDEFVQTEGPVGSFRRWPGSFYTGECGSSEVPAVLHFSGPCAPYWRRVGREIRGGIMHQYFGMPEWWPAQPNAMGREDWG